MKVQRENRKLLKIYKFIEEFRIRKNAKGWKHFEGTTKIPMKYIEIMKKSEIIETIVNLLKYLDFKWMWKNTIKLLMKRR